MCQMEPRDWVSLQCSSSCMLDIERVLVAAAAACGGKHSTGFPSKNSSRVGQRDKANAIEGRSRPLAASMMQQ